MAVYNQIAFRFRNDDGTEVTATWKAAQNTNISLLPDVSFRYRLEIEETAGLDSLNLSCQLQYSKNGGAYANINASSLNVRSSASPNLTDSQVTTDQMTASSRAWFAGTVDEVNGIAGSNGNMSNSVADFEWSIIIRGADVAVGDTIDLRGVVNGGAVFASYAAIGRVTVDSVAPSLVAIATAGNGSGSTLVINKPAGTLDGHMMIAAIKLEETLGTVSLAGWTQLLDQREGVIDQLWIGWKRASSEGSSYTFQLTNARWRNGFIATYQSAHATNPPVVGTPLSDNASSANLVIPGITTPSTNSMVLAIGAHRSDRDHNTNTPTGWTKEAIVIAAAERTIHLADLVFAAAGATGDQTMVISAADAGRIGALVYIQGTAAAAVDVGDRATTQPAPIKEAYGQLYPDSVGKNIRTIENSVLQPDGTFVDVHTQVVNFSRYDIDILSLIKEEMSMIEFFLESKYE